MPSPRIIITGTPGSGKSTLALSLMTELRLKNKWVAGILTPEIIKKKEKTGFRIIDIASDETKVLASSEVKGPKIGKYHVDLKELDYITQKFMDHVESSDVIIIDEIGKMEMLSEKFKEMLLKVFSINKPLIVVVNTELVKEYEKSGEIFTIKNEESIIKIKEEILKKMELDH